jgi:hypothetical protein
VGERGGYGLLVDEELARAVRLESVVAVRHWWGVAKSTVWLWRQVFGVERFNEGSAQLRTALNVELGGSQRGKKLAPTRLNGGGGLPWSLGCGPYPSAPAAVPGPARN